ATPSRRKRTSETTAMRRRLASAVSGADWREVMFMSTANPSLLSRQGLSPDWHERRAHQPDETGATRPREAFAKRHLCARALVPVRHKLTQRASRFSAVDTAKVRRWNRSY